MEPIQKTYHFERVVQTSQSLFLRIEFTQFCVRHTLMQQQRGTGPQASASSQLFRASLMQPLQFGPAPASVGQVYQFLQQRPKLFERQRPKPKIIPCPFIGCPKFYKSFNGLKYHVIKYHGVHDNNFCCIYCGKEYKAFGHLKNHLLRHREDYERAGKPMPRFIVRFGQ